MTAVGIDEQYVGLRRDLTNYFVDGGSIAVVKAPPGSGKTHTLIEVLSALVRTGSRIAVAAQTNGQADDICLRIARSHPEVLTARFASSGHRVPDDFPDTVPWISDKNHLPQSPGITVGTTAKWSLTNIVEPYDLLAVDEAWQMSWADLMQCALISGRFLLIGDPGQIPPVVTIDVRRWETSPRAPHAAAPEIVLGDAALREVRFVGSLPACRRLPHEAVDFVRPFYDFSFDAYVSRGERGLDLPPGHPLVLLGDGAPMVITIPTPTHGPPIEVDHALAELVSRTVHDLLEIGAAVRAGGGQPRPLLAADVGVSSSHRVMNSALSAALGDLASTVRVDTPERWQGLERPVMVVVHPLSGVTDPSSFDLETGRLCVMASRHEAALIVVSRDHVGSTLADFVPGAEQAPGRPDVVGRGHDAHIAFWGRLEELGRVVAAT